MWKLTTLTVGKRLRQFYTNCLREDIFPRWKRARLVLLHKESKSAESPSACKPICLLYDIGKLFERIIASRVVQHLSWMGPNLSCSQYGFREGTSTIDAIKQVRSLSEWVTVDGGGVALVSLDIANVFNSIP